MTVDDKNGTKPMYRSREWNKEDRDLKKNNRKLNWYKTGQKEIEYKSVLFVPITKGGKLLKEMKKREHEINKNSNERIKIVEGGGVQLGNLFRFSMGFSLQIKSCNLLRCLITFCLLLIGAAASLSRL